MEIVLKNIAYQKIRAYTKSVSTEISGLGKAHYNAETKQWYVEDVRIFEQTVSGVETDMNTDMIGQFIVDLVQSGEDTADWCVWWHSHANMKVFWSSTDTAYMENSRAGDFLLSIVTNHAGEFKARIDLYNYGIIQDDIPVLAEHVSQEIFDAVTAEVAQKVTKKVFSYPKYQKNPKFNKSNKKFGDGWRDKKKEEEEEGEDDAVEYVKSVDRWKDIDDEQGLGDVIKEYEDAEYEDIQAEDNPAQMFSSDELADAMTEEELEIAMDDARDKALWSDFTKYKNALNIKRK